MTTVPHRDPNAPRGRAPLLLLATLLFVLPVFPPETNGQAMAGCAALIVMLVLVCRGGIFRVPGQWGWPAAALLCWPAWLLAAAPGAAVEPLAVALLGVAAGLAAASLPVAVRRSSALPLALAAAGTWVAALALFQKLHGFDELARKVAQSPQLPDQAAVLARLAEGRAYADFATPASLGGFLAIAIAVTAGLALTRRGAARWALSGVAVLQTLGLAAAATATATAAVLAAVLLALLLRRGARRVLLPGAAAALLALLAVVAVRGDRLWDAADPGSPWRLRAANFRVAWSMYLDHPWTGVGPGGYAELYPAYRRPADNESRHTHNLPLELAAETGTAGVLLLAPLFFLAFLRPLIRSTRDDPAWVGGAGIGLAAFALHNLADFTAFLPSLFWLACLLCGCVSRAGPTAASGEAPAAGRVRAVVAATAVFAVAAVAGLAGLAAEARLAGRQAAIDGEREALARWAERATRLAPWNVDGWLLRSQAILDDPRTTGDDATRADRALACAERAVRLSPVRPVARRVRAAARAAADDLAGAYADLVQAARLYPYKTDYALQRDELALRLGGADAAGTAR